MSTQANPDLVNRITVQQLDKYAATLPSSLQDVHHALREAVLEVAEGSEYFEITADLCKVFVHYAERKFAV